MNAPDTEERLGPDELARELHDGVGQLLTAARLMAEGTPGCPPIVASLLTDAIIELQRVCQELMRADPARLGLGSALAQLCASTNQLPGVSCTLSIEQGAIPRATRTAHALHRIAQEAVGNAIAHSGANVVEIELRTKKKDMVLDITDNGRWLPADPNATHYGLDNMRLRAEELGGTFKIRRGVGNKGTRIRCRLPRQDSAAARVTAGTSPASTKPDTPETSDKPGTSEVQHR